MFTILSFSFKVLTINSHTFLRSGLLLISVLSLLAIGCQKKDSGAPDTGGGRNTVTAPFVTLTLIIMATAESATLNCEVLSDGGAAVSTRGFVWGLKITPTVSDSKKEAGNGIGKFSADISGLKPGTKYYTRAFATNSVGTTYGVQDSFFTSTSDPIMITSPVSAITARTAVSGGNISSDGGRPVIARGICWSTSLAPDISKAKTSDGAGVGQFVSTMTDLAPNTKYYVRVYASTSSFGTLYGSAVEFTTPAELPVITTDKASPVLSKSAVSGGVITSASGNITERGICWSLTSDPNINDPRTKLGPGDSDFKSTMTNLGPNLTYYVRAYATNSAGTAYGPQQTFKTTQTVTDADGNVYQTVVIGSQTWMVENLKTKKFNNGDAIATTSSPTTDLYNVIFPLYQWSYNSDEKNADIYGRLYTLNVVKDARQIAPVGWHIPSDEEWQTLKSFLGSNAGLALKETGTVRWINQTEGTNTSGFSALPGGLRGQKAFEQIGTTGAWWSRTVFTDLSNPWGQTGSYWMLAHNSFVRHTYFPFGGMSVRCVKD